MTIRKAVLLFAAAAPLMWVATDARAQMEPFIGQVSLFANNFCPRGWTEANGQLIAISQNTALFSLIGTIYRGDGRSTLALPDLRGRAPEGFGQGPDLSNIPQGARGGAEQVTIPVAQVPSHAHAATTLVEITSTLNAAAGVAATGTPAGGVVLVVRC